MPSSEFTHARTVVPEDIDEQGHVSNIAYLRFVQDVATAHSASVGFERRAYSELGGAFVVRKHQIEYFRPAFLADALSITTSIASFRGARCERHTRVVRVSDGEVLARASTIWAFIQLETGRPRRIPEAIQVAFTD